MSAQNGETTICMFYCKGMLAIKESEQFGDGRVEILDDSADLIKPICADEHWGTSEVDIVCKQIGFQGASNSRS